MQYSYIYPHSSGYWPEPNDHDAWWNSKRYMNAMTFPIARHWSDCWTICQNNTKETSKSSQQALCEENPLSKRPITHKGFPLHEVIIILLVHIDLFVVECIAMMPYYKHARWYQWQVTLRIEPRSPRSFHYSDVIMNGLVSETTSVSTVYSTVCSGVDKKTHNKAPHYWPLCMRVCWGLTGEFPAQRASNTVITSIWWRHHVEPDFVLVH